MNPNRAAAQHLINVKSIIADILRRCRMSVKEERGDAARKADGVKKYKPGQKHPIPSPGTADRVFYETLHAQRPESRMALEWCVANGVFPVDKAEKVFKWLQAQKKKERAGAKVSSAPSFKKGRDDGRIIMDAGGDLGMAMQTSVGIGTSTMGI